MKNYCMGEVDQHAEGRVGLLSKRRLVQCCGTNNTNNINRANRGQDIEADRYVKNHIQLYLVFFKI
jgi:hypothetical protein